MTGINGPGYSSFGAGEPFKQPFNTQQDQSFLDSWASRSAIWGTRHGVGEALDRYMGLHSPAVSSSFSNELAELGIDDFEGKRSSVLGYDRILKLKNDYVPWRELNWKSFKSQVKSNTYELRQALKPGQGRSFFAGIPLKTYLKETLWEGNIRPFKELFSGSKQNLFMNLGYTVGVGLSGASVVKTGVQQYRHWHQWEDGSFSSRLKTLYETIKATGQKAIQAFGSWEAASIGMTVGRGLIPIGSIPVGGVLVGGLFATTAYKVIGKLFPSLSRPAPSES